MPIRQAHARKPPKKTQAHFVALGMQLCQYPKQRVLHTSRTMYEREQVPSLSPPEKKRKRRKMGNRDNKMLQIEEWESKNRKPKHLGYAGTATTN